VNRRLTPAAAALAAAAILAACGSSSAGRSPDGTAEAASTLLPASALPGMRATTTDLSATTLTQATPIPGLAKRLTGWGMQGAAAREFTRVGGALDHVVSRNVAFATPRGAAGYLEELVAQRDAYLGPGADLHRVAGGWIIRQPMCGCHPQPPTLIALLRDGARVRWLSVSGRDATPARTRALTHELL
jgi:hypothetical protein